MKKDNWFYKVFLLTFLLSIIFSTVTNLIAYNATQIVMLVMLMVIIFIGIIFDMVATSALTSNEATFHAMSSKKIKGAKETIEIIKNSVKFASICGDVIGDICGIMSGGIGAVLAMNLALTTEFNVAGTSVIIGALISAFTVGGKALCKAIAVKNSDKIIFTVGTLKYMFKIKK